MQPAELGAVDAIPQVGAFTTGTSGAQPEFRKAPYEPLSKTSAPTACLITKPPVRSPSADPGGQKWRKKTGRSRLEADWPHAFEPDTVSAGADSPANGVCDRHRRKATGHYFLCSSASPNTNTLREIDELRVGDPARLFISAV